MFPAIILLFSILAFRIAPWMAGSSALQQVAGFSPLMAFALCGGMFLPKKWAVILPAAAMAVSGAVINVIHGAPVLHYATALTAGCAVLAAMAGAGVKKKASVSAAVAASLLCTVLFYLVSNTVSFLMEPGYAKTAAGWWQCLTTGLPGFLPTWVFGLRQLAGDAVFTVLFHAAFRGSLPPLPVLPSRESMAAAA